MDTNALRLEKLEKICSQKLNDEMFYVGKFWIIKWKKCIKKLLFDRAASLVFQALQYRVKRNVSQIYYQIYMKYSNMANLFIRIGNRHTFKTIKKAYRAKCKVPKGLEQISTFVSKHNNQVCLNAFRCIKESVLSIIRRTAGSHSPLLK